MNIVDSSGWLAYFADEPGAKYFAVPLKNVKLLIVPVITIYEVYKVILREAGEDSAIQAITAMQKGNVIPLTPELAIFAARISNTYNLPMADSIILATAEEYNATIWTHDKDFKKFKNVKYFEKTKST